MQLEQLVEQALAGDKDALTQIVTATQDDIYYLALRMLFNPADAEDATQEILIKVITKLSTFQFKSTFKTWVYRVATNYLLNNKKVLAKDPALSFELYQNDLEQDLEPAVELEQSPEYPVLLNEVRIACTMAMLLCLNHTHRMAYILGVIFELEHGEASEILSLSKANFRQQLSRARNKVTEFTSNCCGLVSKQAKCCCDMKLKGAIRRGRIIPGKTMFATGDQRLYSDVKENLMRTKQALKSVSLQTTITPYKCPQQFGELIDKLLQHANQIPHIEH